MLWYHWSEWQQHQQQQQHHFTAPSLLGAASRTCASTALSVYWFHARTASQQQRYLQKFAQLFCDTVALTFYLHLHVSLHTTTAKHTPQTHQTKMSKLLARLCMLTRVPDSSKPTRLARCQNCWAQNPLHKHSSHVLEPHPHSYCPPLCGCLKLFAAAAPYNSTTTSWILPSLLVAAQLLYFICVHILSCNHCSSKAMWESHLLHNHQTKMTQPLASYQTISSMPGSN